MTEWIFADIQAVEEFAQLHFFSIKKGTGSEAVEFRITVYEYASQNNLSMRFFAQADKHVNQKAAAFLPFGWGATLLGALIECVKSLRSFPYEGTR